MPFSEAPPVDTITGRRSRRDLFEQRPVVRVRTRDFNYGEIELNAIVDRFLIERRRHRNAARATNRFDKLRKSFLAKPRIFRLLDVPQYLRRL